jgi:hypothetical protein
MCLASPPGRQPASDQLGHPLAHRQGVDPGQRISSERRKHLLIEQLAVIPPSRVAQRRRGVVPALGPLDERHLAGGRVDVGAAQLGVLDGD